MAFYSACVLGPMGYLFADLGKHSYAPAAKGDGAPAAAQLLNFCSMETALGASWAGLRRRCHKMYHHLAIAAEFERQHGTPIAAGSQEAIRALSEQVGIPTRSRQITQSLQRAARRAVLLPCGIPQTPSLSPFLPFRPSLSLSLSPIMSVRTHVRNTCIYALIDSKWQALLM